MTVQFLRPYGAYAKDATQLLDNETEASLVSQGLAKYVNSAPAGWSPETPAQQRRSIVLQTAGVSFASPARDIVIVGTSISCRSRYAVDTDTANGAYFVWARSYWNYASSVLKGAFQLKSICGESGYSIARIAELLPTQAVNYRPQFYVVEAGINDIPLVDFGDTGDTIFARYRDLLVTPLLDTGAIVLVCEFMPDGTTSAGTLTTPARIAAYFRFNQLVREFARSTPNTVLVPWTSRGFSSGANGYTPISAFTDDQLHPNNYGALFNGKILADALAPFVRSGDFLGANGTDQQNYAIDPTTVLNSPQFSSTNVTTSPNATYFQAFGGAAAPTGSMPAGWGVVLTASAAVVVATSVVADTLNVPGGNDWLNLVVSGTAAAATSVQIDGRVNTLAGLGLVPGDWIEATWECDLSALTGLYGLSPYLFFNGVTGSGLAAANSPPVSRRFARLQSFDVVPAGTRNIDLTVLKSISLPAIKIPAGCTGLRMSAVMDFVPAGTVAGTIKLRNPVIRKVPRPETEPVFGYAGALFKIP